MSPDIYAEALRRVVRGWRHDEWRRTKRSERGPEPSSAELVHDDLVRCAWVLCRAYQGAHRVPGHPRVHPRHIEIVHYAQAATTDDDLLTRLVTLAHDAAVRVEVCGAAPKYMRIALHPRVRAASIMSGHPTLEDHASRIREHGAPCPIGPPADEPARAA